jgi:hypothetical protein
MSVSFHPYIYNAPRNLWQFPPAERQDPEAFELNVSNANGAVRVDCRPKTIKPKKGKGSYRRATTDIGARADAERRAAGSTGRVASKSALS